MEKPKCLSGNLDHLFKLNSDKIGTCLKCHQTFDFLKAEKDAGVKDNMYNYSTASVPKEILPDYYFNRRAAHQRSISNRRPLSKYD